MKHWRSSAYRMHSRMASPAFQSHDDFVFLFGDAAHLIEPFTGQGISNGYVCFGFFKRKIIVKQCFI